MFKNNNQSVVYINTQIVSFVHSISTHKTIENCITDRRRRRRRHSSKKLFIIISLWWHNIQLCYNVIGKATKKI